MIVGVAGTAKNTGKTTTLCALIDEAYRRGRLPGVTGIGYDGEERDNVTLLPKPRIMVHPGMVVTTSEQCLAASTARLRVIQDTGYRTALGAVLMCRVEAGGLVVVAGPNKTADLAAVARQMSSLGVADLLVDGSLNRIAPMVVAERVVFATGGARSTDGAALVGEIQAIERVFDAPAAPPEFAAVTGFYLRAKDLSVQVPAAAVLGAREIGKVLERMPAGLISMVLPGLISMDGLGVVCDRLEGEERKGATLVFDDPFKLLLAGDPVRVAGMLRWMQELGVEVRYRRPSRLAAITFNPYYPAFDGTTYRAAFLDDAIRRAALATAMKTPVVDIKGQGVTAVFDACFN
jgi:hypothetical protein